MTGVAQPSNTMNSNTLELSRDRMAAAKINNGWMGIKMPSNKSHSDSYPHSPASSIHRSGEKMYLHRYLKWLRTICEKIKLFGQSVHELVVFK